MQSQSTPPTAQRRAPLPVNTRVIMRTNGTVNGVAGRVSMVQESASPSADDGYAYEVEVDLKSYHKATGQRLRNRFFAVLHRFQLEPVPETQADGVA